MTDELERQIAQALIEVIVRLERIERQLEGLLARVERVSGKLPRE